MKKILALLICTALLLCIAYASDNIYNGSFEMFEDGQPPAGWYSESYVSGTETFESSPDGYTGCCAMLQNKTANDARITQQVECEPNSAYILTAKVRTEGVLPNGNGGGASITVQPYGTKYGSNAVSSAEVFDGDGWQDAFMYIKTLDNANCFYIWLRLGNYSRDNTGIAYFDDVSLQKISTVPEDTEYAVIGVKQTNGTAVLFAITLLLMVTVAVVVYNKSNKQPGKPVKRKTIADDEKDEI